MSYVYIQPEPNLWTVGFYALGGEWIPESDHDSREKAAWRVHWLNGGKKPEGSQPDDRCAYHELLEACKMARDALLAFGLAVISNDFDFDPQVAEAMKRLEGIGARLDSAIAAREGVATSTKGESMMREQELVIRLIQDLPIDPRHGMKAGRELRAIRTTPIEHPKRNLPRWIVVGDAGEKVGVFSREAEVVNAVTHENDNTTRTCETMIYAGFTERVCSSPAVALVDAGSNNERAICLLCANLSDRSRLTYYEEPPGEEADDSQT